MTLPHTASTHVRAAPGTNDDDEDSPTHDIVYTHGGKKPRPSLPLSHDSSPTHLSLTQCTPRGITSASGLAVRVFLKMPAPTNVHICTNEAGNGPML